MLFWLVDNSAVLLLLFGIIALGFGARWWVTRKPPWLIGCGVTVGLMLMVIILSLTIVSDKAQIIGNIEAMRDAFNTRKVEETAKLFDDEVTVETAWGSQKLSNINLATFANNNMQHYGVTQVNIGPIDIEELARPKAVASFPVWAENDWTKRGICRVEFLRTPQGQWRIKKFTVVSGGQPVLLPSGRN